MPAAELAALAAELRARAELLDEGDWSSVPEPSGEPLAAAAAVLFVAEGGAPSGEAAPLFEKILAAVDIKRSSVAFADFGSVEAAVRAGPRAVVALGDAAAERMLSSSEGVARLRGRWHAVAGVPLLVTYHPAALLRDASLKRPVWEDMKALKARLEDK